MKRYLSPEVERRWLLAVSGVLWSAVGVMLVSLAVGWLAPVALPTEIVLGGSGVVLALLAARFMFRGIARHNIERIQSGPERASIFAFQPVKSYVIMFGMMALGITLRHSAVPKPALAVVYVAIGGALAMASGLYHRSFVRYGRAEAC